MNWMLTFFFIFPLFFSSYATCPVGTIASFTDKTICYLFNSTKQSYLIAEGICTQSNGHLVSIHNMFENVFVQEQAQQLFTESAESNFWIGITDLLTPGTWGWIDGSPVDFVDWDKGQPDNIPGHDCGAENLQGGNWITDNCDNQKPFVCKIIIPQNTTNAPPTTPKLNKCDDSWIYFDRTNSCYKVLHNLSWIDAENACFSEGAHLTSIHSSEENNFIANLIPFYQNCVNNDNYVWFGLYTIDNQQSWQWTDDSKLNFTFWATSHPSHNNLSFCGAMSYGLSCNSAYGSWFDGYCPVAVGFSVCKKQAQI